MSSPVMAVANETIEQKIARLESENAALKAAKAKGGKLSLKVSEKGGLSVYGLGRFPVTLYCEQWGRLLAFTPEITAFIKAHESELSVKE